MSKPQKNQRLPTQIIGEDAYNQLIFEGYSVIAHSSEKTLDIVAKQHRKTDKHGVQSDWQNYAKPLFESDTFETRNLVTENNALSVVDQLNKEISDLKTQNASLKSQIEANSVTTQEKLRSIAYLNVSPIGSDYIFKTCAISDPGAISVTSYEKALEREKAMLLPLHLICDAMEDKNTDMNLYILLLQTAYEKAKEILKEK